MAQRLPKHVKPTHYDLVLNPDLIACTFKGRVKISLEVLERVSSIVLNSVDLNLEDVRVSCISGDLVAIKSIDIKVDDEIVIFHLEKELSVMNAELEIEFNGVLTDKLRGFYRNKYFVGGEERFAAVTQFESTDARRSFPCWDEPSFKATFDITLFVSTNKAALSNMHQIYREPSPKHKGKDVVKFDTTPIMSTYLVAFIVGEFDFITGKTSHGVEVRVYTSLGKQKHGKFGLDTAIRTLEYFTGYFGIGFPLKKCDLIGLQDFSIGAMENWGLITYREGRLLVDPENSSSMQHQTTANIIGHEVSHQWFGNLVTMEWWTDLWLKEGFARFMEYSCVNVLYPEFDIWKQFVHRVLNSALHLDSLKSSHPIEIVVSNPGEIEEIFDDISYAKGASIIRMLAHYIGKESFQKGLQLYLKRHSYGNAHTRDLWVALQEVSEKAIEVPMSTWTRQMGYPLISVSCKQEGSHRRVMITQQRFLIDGSKDQTSHWVVPIQFSSSANPQIIFQEVLLDEKRTECSFEMEEKSWLKVNSGAVGFYRTLYDDEMLKSLIPAIEARFLPAIDRLNILDDLYALMMAGYVSISQVLDVLKKMENEDDCTVWQTIATCYTRLGRLLSNSRFHEAYRAFVWTNIQKVFQQVGLEPKKNEGHTASLLRGIVLNLMAQFGNDDFFQLAKERLKSHICGKTIIPADQRSAIYEAAMAKGDNELLNQMMKLHNDSTHHEERTRICSSLGCTDDEEQISKVCEFAMSDSVRIQDKGFALGGLTTAKGRQKLWSLIKSDFHVFKDMYKVPALFSHIINAATRYSATEDMANEVEDFFQRNVLAGCERNIKQSIETIRLNSKWLERNLCDLEKYFSQ